MRAVLARAAVLAGAFTAGAVAARAATLPHLRRLTSDLQRSRERILASREEERRQLRNDLHDGLGPTLASLAMSLDAARITLACEPERTDPLLADVRDRLATAVGEIRDLAHGLRPPRWTTSASSRPSSRSPRAAASASTSGSTGSRRGCRRRWRSRRTGSRRRP
ncbi:histidine kinase [Actinomadura madurae]|uniref:histidine kinase n=1 Tax=Actinomadura madurae TaxID=1993 RepID=UPI0020D1F8F3|nr:histidine kinase [Actinomadura madurae]MCP9966304.1 histidine kinase [Actinomadura madurae]MCQ0009681.1 histidine kinase [Actinomadura madurae]